MSHQPGHGPSAKWHWLGMGVWLLVPLVCCGGPLLIGALAATGLLVWAGLAAAALMAVAVELTIRRRIRACRGRGSETCGYR